MRRNFGDDELQRLYKKAEFDREHKEVKKIEKRIRSLVDEISVYILCFHMTSRGIHIWVSAIMEPLGSVI